jgi:hypothetical protein
MAWNTFLDNYRYTQIFLDHPDGLKIGGIPTALSDFFQRSFKSNRSDIFWKAL